MPQPPVPIGVRPQLLVDDYLIASIERIQTRLHAMTKHPEPVLRADPPWECPETSGLWGVPNALCPMRCAILMKGCSNSGARV